MDIASLFIMGPVILLLIGLSNASRALDLEELEKWDKRGKSDD